MAATPKLNAILMNFMFAADGQIRKSVWDAVECESCMIVKDSEEKQRGLSGFKYIKGDRKSRC